MLVWIFTEAAVGLADYLIAWASVDRFIIDKDNAVGQRYLNVASPINMSELGRCCVMKHSFCIFSSYQYNYMKRIFHLEMEKRRLFRNTDSE